MAKGMKMSAAHKAHASKAASHAKQAAHHAAKAHMHAMKAKGMKMGVGAKGAVKTPMMMGHL